MHIPSEDEIEDARMQEKEERAERGGFPIFHDLTDDEFEEDEAQNAAESGDYSIFQPDE